LIIDSYPRSVAPPQEEPLKPRVEEGDLVISSGILLSEDQIWPGEEVWGAFVLYNTSEITIHIDSLVLAIRGAEDGRKLPDFTEVVKEKEGGQEIILSPRQYYRYDGENKKLGEEHIGNQKVIVQAHLSQGEHAQGQTNWYQPIANPNHQGENPPVAEVPINVREMTEIEKYGTECLQKLFGYDLKSGDAEWTTENIDWLVRLLAELPPTFHHLPSLVKFKRVHSLGKAMGIYNDFPKSISLADSAFTVTSPLDLGTDIACFDTLVAIFDREVPFRGYTVHELTHAMQYADMIKATGKKLGDICQSPLVRDYAAVSEWEWSSNCVTGCKYRGVIEDLPGGCQDSPIKDLCIRWCIQNSGKGPVEDMAEAVRYYLTEPKHLREGGEKRKARYDYLKERIFLGAEY